MTLPLIIDDVIPAGYQDAIEADLTKYTFPWLYADDVTYGSAYGSNAGMSHVAYNFGQDPSEYYPFIMPLTYSIEAASGIKINKLLRIRVGFLTPRLELDYAHNAPHVDFLQDHYTACYYVNDSDGDTLMFDKNISDMGVDINDTTVYNYTTNAAFTLEARCAPKKGRVFVMNGRQFHASTNPRDFKRRLVITINWL